MMPDRWMRNAVAEAIGAFALVFVGVLVITSSGGDLTAIALAYGLTVAVFVAALAHVSGGHFNPAITLAMLLSRAIGLRGALTYWAAQLVGGLAAALVVLVATDRDVVVAGTPVIAEGVGVPWAILLEAAATFVLVLVVYGTVADDRAPFSAYPFAIGFAITAGIFAIGPMTGGALNPARGFGPALVSGDWGATASWLIGPLLGGVLAWAVYEFVINPRVVADDPAAVGDVPPPPPVPPVQASASGGDAESADATPAATEEPDTEQPDTEAAATETGSGQASAAKPASPR